MSTTALLEESTPQVIEAVGSQNFVQNGIKSLPSEQTEPALLHRSLWESPNNVISASGINLHLSDGRTIIDGCGGAAVAILGHGNKEVAQAITEQLSKVSYVHTLSYTVDAAEELAHILIDGNPHGFSKAYFVGSGSEVNDAAMKLVRQYWFEQGQRKRTNFISRKQGYHGNTLGAMSLSMNVSRRIPYEDILNNNVTYISPAYAYQYQQEHESTDIFVDRLAKEFEAEILRLGPETVAAFFAETVGGATTGCVPPPPGYFSKIRQICDKFGILLVLDEIMCGTGRTGTFYAFEQENIVPDIVTIGKGLGGGYAPCAAMIVSEKIVKVLRNGSGLINHGQTYQAHPISCSAALAVQKIIRRESLLENCRKMGQELELKLRQTLGECKYVGNIRGRGLFWGVEFIKDRTTKATFDPAIHFGLKVQQKAFEAGVAVYPGAGTVDGIRGDHVILSPPYNVTINELDSIVSSLEKAYNAVVAEIEV